MILRSPPGGTPCRHWNIAECSESAGVMKTPCFFSRGTITGPAAMRVSLLASATSLPFSIAAMVGSSPAQPTMPVTTMSAWSILATSQTPSIPVTSVGLSPSIPSSSASSAPSLLPSSRATIAGRNSLICSASSSTLDLAARPTSSKFCGRSRMMSSVCVPMDPVDPSSDMRLLNDSTPLVASSKVAFIDSSEPVGAACAIRVRDEAIGRLLVDKRAGLRDRWWGTEVNAATPLTA
mmetsp:Transcript_8414/g.20591  ORF Transcript_8414/g.20591 Transcript_8414/m.20591 type:complete len:236 (+) Transcript_8414:898-1605(+)